MSLKDLIVKKGFFNFGFEETRGIQKRDRSEINRVLVVTGVPFYFTGLAAMEANKEEGVHYRDILFLAHTNFSEGELNTIMRLVNLWSWDEVHNISLIYNQYYNFVNSLNIKNYFNFPFIINAKYTRFRKLLEKQVLELIGPSTVIHELYFGWVPYGHRLLLRLFKNAKYIRYDEGSESYRVHARDGGILLKRGFKPFISKLPIFYKDILLKNRELRSDYTKNCFSLDASWIKCPKMINTRKYYIDLLRYHRKKMKIKFNPSKNKKLLVLLANLHRTTHTNWGVTVEKEGEVFRKKIEYLKNQLDIRSGHVYIKPHPRTDIEHITFLTNLFGDYQFIQNQERYLPAELLFEGKEWVILSVLSSGILSAKLLYNSPLYIININEITLNRKLQVSQGEILKHLSFKWV